MRIIPLAAVEVRKRQRSQMAPQPLEELRDSILGRGLLHPPVCWYDEKTKTWVLTAGERRLTAIQLINKVVPTPTFWCGEEHVQPGHIPITPLGEYLDEVGRFEAELDENLQRVELHWHDKARALNDLHEMRLQQNPKQTLADTGRELAAKGVVQSQAPDAGKSGAIRVRQAQILVRHMDNDKVANARNADEALQLIYKQEEDRALAAIVRRQMTSHPKVDEAIVVRQGDLKLILPKLDPNTYDLIIADPPYGLGADAAGFRARSVVHHNYEDTPEAARELANAILLEGFRLCKTRANIFLFCDIDMFDWLKRTAANMGWVPFRRPIIWQKSESEGMAPWGSSGPRITTEFIFYATKGQRGLVASPTDVFSIRRVSRADRTHGAEKPVELMRELVKYATLPGDSVLDPCCGAGSSLLACRDLKRRCLGIEIDPDYVNTCLAVLHAPAVPDPVS